MRKEELRVIPKKNYLILAGVIIFSLLLIYYFYLWFDAYNETKLNRPILNKYMEVINYNELEDYLVESPNAIIYVSVLEDSEIREFEKQFKSLFKTKQIDKELLYMDITEELKSNKIKNEMDSKYTINNISISNVPVIAVFDNGELRNIYGIKNNNYDMESLKMYVDSINFNNNGEING
jgi:hypothetical protein